MVRSLRKFLGDRKGATALEYSMIAVLVSITIIAGSRQIGSNLSGLYYGRLVNELSK